jgi:hypothetical protein
MSVPEYACSFTSPRVGPDPRPLLGVGQCDSVRPDAKVTRFEVWAKKTLITLESENTIAAGAWIFLRPA